MRTSAPLRRSTATAVLLAALALVAFAGPSAAADPQPTPMVFGSPQYLVFWESHSTSNGPVIDNVYDLFTELPVEPGHFVVADGSGGVFHFFGKLIGGPYASDAELCPQMISLGIASLEVWPPGLYNATQVVDCAQYRQTPVPTADSGGGGGGTGEGTTSGGSGDSGTGGDTSNNGAGGEPTDEALDIAAGLIGLILFGGGLAGLTRGGGPTRPPAPVVPATTVTPVPLTTTAPGPDQAANEPAPDPCGAQLAELQNATAQGRMVNDLLQTNRRVQALLDRQIVHLANVMIPGSFGLDVAFILGGQWGSKLGWGFVPKELLAKALDGAIKDVVKEFAKQGLDAYGQRQLDLDAFRVELLKAADKGKEGGAKAFIKDLLRDSIQARESARRFATPSNSIEQLNARLKMLKGYSENMSGPIADALGHVLSMYNAGIGVATLKEKLDILRIKRDAVLDQTATLEVELESALEKARFARDRLDHCRTINAPGWRA
jgi:hypothetical protein